MILTCDWKVDFNITEGPVKKSLINNSLLACGSINFHLFIICLCFKFKILIIYYRYYNYNNNI